MLRKSDFFNLSTKKVLTSIQIVDTINVSKKKQKERGC